MKKRVCLLVTLLALVIMGFTMNAMNVEAAEIIDRGYCGGEGDGTNLTWTLDSDGVLVVEGQGKMKDWIWDVSDSDSRLSVWHEYNGYIYSVIIQSGITRIGESAFYDCYNLRSITFPDTLVSIGDAAFIRCSSLSSITFPDTLVSIGDAAFIRCSSLSNITFPDTLVRIGDEVFANCTGLNSVTLPNALTSIGDMAFFYCSNLSSIVMPESLESIGYGAFAYCTNLSSIDLPDSLTVIGKLGFANCDNLRSIGLSQSLTSIESSTFRACKNLSNVILPESLNAIGEYAFAYCLNLYSIYIPSNVVSIDQSAFEDAYLKDIYFGGTKAQWINMNIVPTDVTYEMNNGLSDATIHCAADDYKKLNDFVSRLYRNFLKREPDEKGLADWVDVLVSGRGTGAKVVAGFVLSPEYKANSLSNKEYVTALYRIIFNREPDAEGLNDWIGVIENGCTYKKVLAGFVNSDEFDNLCRGMGVARGIYYSDEVADQNVKIAAFVARLYKICLGRSYDQEGLNNWVNALASCTMTGSSVVRSFFDSQEFKSRELDDASFVTTAYQSILDREPDSAGLQSWIDVLAEGKTRNYVLNGFLKSVEFDNLCKEYRIASGKARKVKDLRDILYEDAVDIYYRSDYLEGFSDRELKLARNEFYARRGCIFEDTEIAEYFSGKEWYEPSIPEKEFDKRIFNESEREIIQNILSEEEKRANERANLSEKEWLMAEIERFLNMTPANGFLWSTFSEPGPDVDLHSIIYQVGGVGVDYETLQRERNIDKYRVVIAIMIVSYINSDNLDELLYRLTGYGLYDKKWDLSDIPYLKSIDTYYIEHRIMSPIRVKVKEIKNLGNNTYEVTTEPQDYDDLYDNRCFRTIKLRRIEAGGYQFISVQ